MELSPKAISEEYKKSVNFKESLGEKGMFEQNRINERFYIGDQWYNSVSGNDRPLVRHNIIKRIGEYKIAQVLSRPVTVEITAEGVPDHKKSARKALRQGNEFEFTDKLSEEEINCIMMALTEYRSTTSKRVGFKKLCCDILKKAYLNGTGILYTYWDSSVKTGLFMDKEKSIAINGDICCEVLNVENVCFGDPFEQNIQSQPYIIIANSCDIQSVIKEAVRFGADKRELLKLKPQRNNKITVYTKLFKTSDSSGRISVKCLKTTDSAVIRPVFDTRLTRYPLEALRWEEKGNMIYGESEVTYLVANQIAINRMITASVWATMSKGMPLMIVNGDTVPDGITNDPGQIIKIYGSNEDINSAVRFIDPPDFSNDLINGVNDLIKNTLTQSGANEVALGDSKAENATALTAMQNAASLPLIILRDRFYHFIENVTRIWLDFWVTQYGNRKIKLENEEGIFYIPFYAERYKDLYLNAKICAEDESGQKEQSIKLLGELFDKGVINKYEYLKRLPKNYIPDLNELLDGARKDEKNDG